MDEQFEVSLVGAESFTTLLMAGVPPKLTTPMFRKGIPATVGKAAWAALQKEVNPGNGATMFCLTSELPPPPPEESQDLSSADLRRGGGLGESDTGAQAERDLSNIPDGADRSDLDADDAPAPVAPSPSKKVVLGKGKSVTV